MLSHVVEIQVVKTGTSETTFPHLLRAVGLAAEELAPLDVLDSSSCMNQEASLLQVVESMGVINQDHDPQEVLQRKPIRWELEKRRFD